MLYGAVGRVGIRSFLGGFSPISLFSAGEQGAWYDPSDFSTMFQDSAGTTPVTAVEQPVGRILDKSGRGNHASQSTSASRPVLSARVNLLTYSEQFDNAAWTKTNATVTANAAVSPDGTANADKLVEDNTSNAHSVNGAVSITNGTTYTATVYAKAAERSFIIIQPISDSRYAFFNLSNGTVGVTNGSPTATSITNVGGGWYRCSITAAATSTAVTATYIYVASADGTISYAGNGTSGIFIWGADIRAANDGVGLPVYQRIAAATDYDTTGFPYYLRFDGTDDSLATATFTPGTDKVQAFSGVRKLSDAATGSLVELSNGTGFNDAFAIQTETGASYRSLLVNLTPNSFSTGATPSSFAAPITNVVAGLYDRALSTAATENVLRVNSVQQTLTFSVSGVTSGNFGAYPLFIGRRGGTTLPLNGRIYSLIIRFGANLDAATISNAETWVNGKTMAY